LDTAARLAPTECAQVLADLGFAGLGGRPATASAHADALSDGAKVALGVAHDDE
jgi:hypothetical protein